MYDKLGEMLNEALESGKIPQNNTTKSEKDPEEPVVECSQSECIETTTTSGSDIFKSGSDNLNHRHSTKNPLKSKKSPQIPTGEVIKMHKYTYNMQFPPQIQLALTTLDIAYPFTQKDIAAAYHKKLKEVHPDTKTTIQSSKDVENIRQISIDDIRNSYKILCDFFEIK